MLNKFAKICFILALTCGSNFARAFLSKQMTLVGEVTSFDQTHVRVKSGNQEYVFLKEELDHPSYSVGNRIEIPFDEKRMRQAKVKKMRSDKISKVPGER